MKYYYAKNILQVLKKNIDHKVTLYFDEKDAERIGDAISTVLSALDDLVMKNNKLDESVDMYSQIIKNQNETINTLQKENKELKDDIDDLKADVEYLDQRPQTITEYLSHIADQYEEIMERTHMTAREITRVAEQELRDRYKLREEEENEED